MSQHGPLEILRERDEARALTPIHFVERYRGRRAVFAIPPYGGEHVGVVERAVHAKEILGQSHPGFVEIKRDDGETHLSRFSPNELVRFVDERTVDVEQKHAMTTYTQEELEQAARESIEIDASKIVDDYELVMRESIVQYLLARFDFVHAVHVLGAFRDGRARVEFYTDIRNVPQLERACVRVRDWLYENGPVAVEWEVEAHVSPRPREYVSPRPEARAVEAIAQDIRAALQPMDRRPFTLDDIKREIVAALGAHGFPDDIDIHGEIVGNVAHLHLSARAMVALVTGDDPYQFELDFEPTPEDYVEPMRCVLPFGDSFDTNATTAYVTSSADFPHRCPKCGGAAYVGLTGVEHPPGVACS